MYLWFVKNWNKLFLMVVPYYIYFLWEKNIRLQDMELKYTSYVISNFGSAIVVFYGYPENLTTTDNTHKCCLTWHFKEKKYVFLRNTVNKHIVINVILTELKKPECNMFHLYNDADIDIRKLSVQSSKFLEMSCQWN